MKLIFQILLLVNVVIASSCKAQNDQSISLNIGDPAPPMRVSAWLKGEPIQYFKKGRVYVVEFWATWCVPCKAAMPHLSTLAREYKDKVAIIGVDVMEKKNTNFEKVSAFVDSMALQMDYYVAVQDSNFMETDWLAASGEQSIPKTFVINGEGKLAWIGHPSKLDQILPKILNSDWDIEEVLTKRNSDRYLRELEDSLNYELMKYKEDRLKPGDLGKPELALLEIKEILREEPRLEYSPLIAMHTFNNLLKTEPHKAYEYGKVAIVTSTYQQPPYDFIIGSINWYSDKLNLPAEIYLLGAEAYQEQIEGIVYPELVKLSKSYTKMAEWYWRANEKAKAIEAQQKAIEALKSEKDSTKEKLATLEFRLEEYKKR